MPDTTIKQMLLVESEPLLRRTVALTARTLGIGNVHEAGNAAVAKRILREQVFQGAVISLDFGHRQIATYDLELLDQVRDGKTASSSAMPIAVMADSCDSALLQALRERNINRVILKPFRARVLIDVFNDFSTKPK
jgi:CheY-like chemotaxis protein